MQVFTAIKSVDESPGFTLKGADELSMSATISTRISNFTWGETLAVSCLPADGGTIVQVSATGRVGGQIMQSARNAKMIAKLFDEISANLR